MKNKYQKFNKWLQSYIDWKVEYDTEHEDSGGNYLDCGIADSYDYQGGDKLFSEWLIDNEIELYGLEVEAIACHLFDNQLTEMESGSIYGVSKYRDNEIFIVGSFPLQEIEISIELCAIEKEFGKHGKSLWLKACKDNEFCLRGEMDGDYPCGYAYEATDCVWFAVWEKSVIESAIAEMVEEMEIV